MISEFNNLFKVFIKSIETADDESLLTFVE